MLAAGLLADREIREGTGEIINITMKPLVVDTVFRQTGTVVEAALPAAQAGGARLSPLMDTKVVWTLTRGFKSLLEAQGKIVAEKTGYEISPGREILPRSTKKTVPRMGGGEAVTADAALSGRYDDEIVLNLGYHAVGTGGSANFTIAYAPFGVSGMDAFTGFDEPNPLPWIIRNGVNDEPQNDGTVFPSPTATTNSPWTGTAADKPNGNGAVAFNFVGAGLDLTGKVPVPVMGKTPEFSSFTTALYTGEVVWNTSSTGTFRGGVPYRATITLTAAPGFSLSALTALMMAILGPRWRRPWRRSRRRWRDCGRWRGYARSLFGVRCRRDRQS